MSLHREGCLRRLWLDAVSIFHDAASEAMNAGRMRLQILYRLFQRVKKNNLLSWGIESKTFGVLRKPRVE